MSGRLCNYLVPGIKHGIYVSVFFCFFDSLEKVTNTTRATAVFFFVGQYRLVSDELQGKEGFPRHGSLVL